MPNKPPRRPYQDVGVGWLSMVGRGILADEMGLGKSRQLIEASQGPTLVVAPAMVLAGGTWDDEITRWADDPGRFTQVAYTDLSPYLPHGKGRAPSLRLHENLRGPWGTVIFDEAHYVKGRTFLKKGRPPSIRAYLAKALAKTTDRVYLATGTPIPNWAHELFTLLQVIDPDEAKDGERLGSYWRWAQEWFAVRPGRFSDWEIGGLRACDKACRDRLPHDPCEHYYQFVEGNLAGRFLQRRRDDVLTDLPPLTRVTIKTTMGPKQRAEYNRMKKDYIANTDDGEVVAWTQGSRQVALDRITTGLDLVDGSGLGVTGTVNNSKLARLAADLADRSRPTVVMAHYRASVEACASIAASLKLRVGVVHGGVPRTQAGQQVRRFQRGELDVLCGSLETLAEGLTLTAADCLIFVEKSFKPSRNEQAERRIHRLGQDRPCTVLDYVTPGTVDTQKRALLAAKTDEQMRYLTAAQFKELL